jgi:hypothetical protein
MAGTTPAALAQKLAQHMAKLATYTAPTTVYAALVTTDSSDATAGTECVDANYDRVPITLANLFSDAGGVLTTILDILWPAAAASYTVHGIEFYDNTKSNGGARCLPFIPISSVVVPINEQFKLPAGSGTVTVS